MKKHFVIGWTSLLLLLIMLPGIFFVSPMPASAHTTQSMVGEPTAHPFCRVYIQYVIKHLQISLDTFLQAKIAARRDVLAQLVKEGKLTQAQADMNIAEAREKLKNDPCS